MAHCQMFDQSNDHGMYRMNVTYTRLPLASWLGPKSWTAALLLAFTGFIAGCGGGGGGSTSPTLTAITVTAPNSSSLAVGSTTQFTATGTYSDGSKAALSTVTWSSSASSVASISGTGLAMALAGGSSTITATSAGVSGSATLTVVALTSITVTATGASMPGAPSVAKGSVVDFVATGTYSDSSTKNITDAVTWDSATTSVATISNTSGTNGVANTLGIGKSAITAVLGSITSPAVTLTVTPATLVSIAVTAPSLSVAKGTPVQFTATGTYTDNTTQNVTTEATWDSFTGTVATISSAGLASTVGAGTSGITAALNGIVSKPVTLTVTPAVLVSIAVTAPTLSVPRGVPVQFTATGTYTDSSTQNLTASATWASTNSTTVASINSAGLANTLPGTGTTVITAKFGTVVSPGVTLTVTAHALVSIAVTPANPSIINGTTQQFTATGTYTDHTTADITATVTWASTNSTTVASIGPNTGLATSLGAGTTSITATDPTTGLVSSPPSDILTVTPVEYVYVANFTSNTISMYQVTQGGALTSLGTAVPAGTNPYSLAVDSTTHSLYVANYNSGGAGSISEYTINANGTLAAISGSPVATGNGPNGITVYNGNVYTANLTDGTVSQFAIGTGGALVTPATNVSATDAAQVVFQTIGSTTYAYVLGFATSGSGTVTVFTVGSNGALTPSSTFTLSTLQLATAFVVDATGTYAYVSEHYNNEVQQLLISQTDGSLSAGATYGVGGNPSSMVRMGSYLYVPNAAAESIYGYLIGSGGLLSQVSDTTQLANSAPNFMAIDASGQYAYVTDRGAGGTGTTLQQFTLATGGVLTPMSTPTVTTGSQPTGIIAVTGP